MAKECLNQTATEVADYLLEKSGDRQVVVGPLVWQPSDGKASRMWYVIACTGDEVRQFCCDQVILPDEDGRKDIIAALARSGVVIHDMDDELDMLRWCEAIWPGERVTSLRKIVEADRKCGGGA
jgi:hypothetical protein